MIAICIRCVCVSQTHTHPEAHTRTHPQIGYLLKRRIKFAAIDMGSLRDFDRTFSLIDRLYWMFGTDNRRWLRFDCDRGMGIGRPLFSLNNGKSDGRDWRAPSTKAALTLPTVSSVASERRAAARRFHSATTGSTDDRRSADSAPSSSVPAPHSSDESTFRSAIFCRIIRSTCSRSVPPITGNEPYWLGSTDCGDTSIGGSRVPSVAPYRAGEPSANAWFTLVMRFRMLSAFFQMDDLRRPADMRRPSSSSSSFGLNASWASSMVGDAERGDGLVLPSIGDGGIISGIDWAALFGRPSAKSGELYATIYRGVRILVLYHLHWFEPDSSWVGVSECEQ